MPAEINVVIDEKSVHHWVRHIYTSQPALFQQFLFQSGEIVKQEMQRTAPRKTGALAESITVERGADYVRVGPTVSYAPFVEFGTRPHEIRPVRAQALRFETRTGGIVFAKRVWHPGFKGRFFMQHALQAAQPRITQLAKSIFTQIYGGVTPRLSVSSRP